MPRAADALRRQFARQRGRGHQHGARMVVEPAHHRPEVRGVQPGAHGRIVREAGVERGGEGRAGALAPAARAPADRAFGGDMDDIGREVLQRAPRAEARGHRQPDLAVAGQGQRAELAGRYKLDLVPARIQAIHRGGQGADNAVDLRVPGIGADRDPHAGSSSRAVDGAGCLPCFISASRVSAAQSTMEIAPWWSSTSAVQLSTQSPSL